VVISNQNQHYSHLSQHLVRWFEEDGRGPSSARFAMAQIFLIGLRIDDLIMSNDVQPWREPFPRGNYLGGFVTIAFSIAIYILHPLVIYIKTSSVKTLTGSLRQRGATRQSMLAKFLHLITQR